MGTYIYIYTLTDPRCYVEKKNKHEKVSKESNRHCNTSQLAFNYTPTPTLSHMATYARMRARSHTYNVLWLSLHSLGSELLSSFFVISVVSLMWWL